jgi:hypothetical protein
LGLGVAFFVDKPRFKRFSFRVFGFEFLRFKFVFWFCFSFVVWTLRETTSNAPTAVAVE